MADYRTPASLERLTSRGSLFPYDSLLRHGQCASLIRLLMYVMTNLHVPQPVRVLGAKLRCLPDGLILVMMLCGFYD